MSKVLEEVSRAHKSSIKTIPIYPIFSSTLLGFLLFTFLIARKITQRENNFSSLFPFIVVLEVFILILGQDSFDVFLPNGSWQQLIIAYVYVLYRYNLSFYFLLCGKYNI